MSFLDLPWEDVVFPMILPCLPLQTLFQLRRVSLKGKYSSLLQTLVLGVVGWCEGAVYLTSLGRQTDIGLQLGKACYPCSG